VSLKFRIMPKWRNVNEHYTQSMELRTIKKNLLLSILDLTVLVSFSKVDNDLMCILTLQGDVQSFFHQFWPHQVVWAHATRMMPDNPLPFLYAWAISTLYIGMRWTLSPQSRCEPHSILTLQGDVQSFFHQFWPHQVVWAHATRMMPDNSLPFLYAWVRSTIYADSTSMIVNMLDKNHFQPTLWHLISSINNNKPINNPKIKQW
jgi:hypothetical protein